MSWILLPLCGKNYIKISLMDNKLVKKGWRYVLRAIQLSRRYDIWRYMAYMLSTSISKELMLYVRDSKLTNQQWKQASWHGWTVKTHTKWLWSQLPLSLEFHRYHTNSLACMLQRASVLVSTSLMVTMVTMCRQSHLEPVHHTSVSVYQN